MNMGQRQHDDPAVVVDSHHNVLASVLGRYLVEKIK